MTMQQVQVNTKFLNALPSEWSKFITNVNLAKSLYTTNYDQLYAYLSQHERHANEFRINHERYPDSLAFVANSPTLNNPSQSPQHSSYSMYPPPRQFIPVYAALIHHPHHHTRVNQFNPQQHPVSPLPFISPSMTSQSQAEFSQLNSGLIIPMFQQGEDLIECINKAMAFLSVVALKFPPSNNKLRTSSNPINQVTIQDGRVTVQQVQGRQHQSYAGERHMARQCTQPKRPRNAAWFKEKLMLAEAQTDDLDAYNSNCDELSSAKVVLMVNLSSCNPEVLIEVPYSESYPNDIINLDVQEIQYSEQTRVDDFKDNEIHSSSNIIRSADSTYDGTVIAKEHAMISVIDDEETFILEEENTFNAFDKSLLDEITEVQTVFNQMEAVVDQCSVDKNVFEIKIKQLRIYNDQLLNQIMSQEIVHIITNSVDICDVNKSCVNDCKKCPKLDIELFKTNDFIEKEAYDKLVKRMFKLDIEPISARLKNTRDAHEVYIETTIKYVDNLCGFVECARTQYPSESLLESACMFTKHVQELLVYASQTCPNSPKPRQKLVAVTSSNKVKRVRFAEHVISSNNIPKQTDSLKTKDSNKNLLTSTGVKPTASASGSKLSGNTKSNRISRPPRSNQKNKVEDHPRTFKSSLNKTNSVFEPISNALVKHSMRNAKFESMCAICNKCLFDANHDMSLVDFVNDVNVRSKSKSKRNKKKKA
nr:hypothetical protein [Tanacetum cinerariifolium]